MSYSTILALSLAAASGMATGYVVGVSDYDTNVAVEPPQNNCSISDKDASALPVLQSNYQKKPGTGGIDRKKEYPPITSEDNTSDTGFKPDHTNDQKTDAGKPFADGMEAFNRGDYNNARVIWEKALSKNPLDIELLQSLAMAYEAEGNFQEYLNMYDKILQEHPDSIDLYSNLAKLLMDRSRPEEATSVLENAVSKNPNDPEFRYLLADHFAELGDNTAAIDNYNAALSANQDDPWGHFFLGQLYAKTNSALAEAEFEKASTLSVEVAKEVKSFQNQLALSSQ